MGKPRQGHGWGAYFLPYIGFLLIVEISGRLPEAQQALALPLKVAVPLCLFLWYLAHGHYPELRGHRFRPWGVLQDVLVGFVGALVWMAPFVLVDDLRPSDAAGFDRAQLGPSLVWLALSLRTLGYGVVTPFVEELFVRSWLARYIDVFDKRVDFRNVPIARYSLRSFVGVALWFTFSHVSWEWPVAALWVMGTQLWFYHRGHLAPMVIVHASSNLTILALVTAFSGVLRDGAGNPIDLWFFV
jgi:CAAX prenyl protease-like protein